MKENEAKIKKTWKTPRLIVHGDVEKITREAPVDARLTSYAS